MRVLKTGMRGRERTGRIRARQGFMGKLVLQVEIKKVWAGDHEMMSKLCWRDASTKDIDLSLDR